MRMDKKIKSFERYMEKEGRLAHKHRTRVTRDKRKRIVAHRNTTAAGVLMELVSFKVSMTRKNARRFLRLKDLFKCSDIDLLGWMVWKCGAYMPKALTEFDEYGRIPPEKEQDTGEK